MSGKRLQESPSIQSVHQITPDNHHVQPAKQFLMEAKTFSDQPLDTVSFYRRAHLFTGNRHPDPGERLSIVPGQHHEKHIDGPARLGKDQLEILFSDQTHFPEQSPRASIRVSGGYQ
jgi:hypothetical protein